MADGWQPQHRFRMRAVLRKDTPGSGGWDIQTYPNLQEKEYS
jgi:hypothetical protein